MKGEPLTNWLDLKTSLYENHADTTGTESTFREILLSYFAIHLPTLIKLRALDPDAEDYDKQSKALKAKLPCFATHLLQSRTGEVIQRNPIIQLDFDSKALYEYDIREVMQAVFSLPCVAFCGLSCSGRGFYVLIMIAEPERQREYAEHCFQVFNSYGLKADTSKGRNLNDLRYISYDCNMMIRENPEPLRIKRFKKKEQPKPPPVNYTTTTTGTDGRIITGLRSIEAAQPGERWQTVQKTAYTFGGIGGSLDDIINRITTNPAFSGLESKYIKCATDCYEAGQKQPII
jgi:hypothetical protein